MGKPLTIQAQDDAKLESLKSRTGSRSKVEVLRQALKLLESNVEEKERIERWKQAASVIADSEREITKDFQRHSQLKKIVD